MKGYKITNPDGTCRNFKSEVGKEYTHDGDMKLCESGFHFCINAAACFNYYDFICSYIYYHYDDFCRTCF